MENERNDFERIMWLALLVKEGAKRFVVAAVAFSIITFLMGGMIGMVVMYKHMEKIYAEEQVDAVQAPQIYRYYYYNDEESSSAKHKDRPVPSDKPKDTGAKDPGRLPSAPSYNNDPDKCPSANTEKNDVDGPGTYAGPTDKPKPPKVVDDDDWT